MHRDSPSKAAAQQRYARAISDAWSKYQQAMDQARKHYNLEVGEAWQQFITATSACRTDLQTSLHDALATYITLTKGDGNGKNENLPMPGVR